MEIEIGFFRIENVPFKRSSKRTTNIPSQIDRLWLKKSMINPASTKNVFKTKISPFFSLPTETNPQKVPVGINLKVLQTLGVYSSFRSGDRV